MKRFTFTGYPEDIAEFQYDHTFPVRGLWFDKQFGNLLKVDSFGNVLVAVSASECVKRKKFNIY